jgi:type III pantothenate kinase
MTLCDIGNTSFHFLENEHQFKVSVEDTIEHLNLKEPIYYISVNKDGEKKLLKKFPNAINIEDKIVLNSNYATTLGIDRALGCYGYSDAVIVDFGSAITVDIIEHNNHLGGFILPGVEKLKEIYPNISQKLVFDYIERINLHTIPTTTNEAISYAINAMIVEPIKMNYQRYNLPLIITGEHGKKFLNYFDNVFYEPNLIFKNMKLLLEMEK